MIDSTKDVRSARCARSIVANRTTNQAQRMAMGGNNISTSLVTFEFLPTDDGSEIVLTHQAAYLEGADGPERRELGWKTLFANLEAELGE